MILVSGVQYRVSVLMPTKSREWKDYRTMQSIMTYCGGSQVDNDGHHIAGGVWAKGKHPNTKYFYRLNVQGIEER